MRALAIAVALLACSKSREHSVCEHGAKLCDGADELAQCAGKLADLRDALGESYDRSLRCAGEATSCPEFVGCFVGGLGNEVGKLGTLFEKGAEKVMRNKVASYAGGSSFLDGCKTFKGGDRSARWDDCGDGVRREVVCKPSFDHLRCDCFEDGAEKWFFTATNPPLGARESASRVATENCRMGFGN